MEFPEEIKELKADSRGRINIGTDYKNQTVRVAIVEVVDED
jgi:hypothetical protein